MVPAYYAGLSGWIWAVGEKIMSERRYDRVEVFQKAKWDFFTSGTGSKLGYVTNISRGGCLLKTNENIEHRRWVRMMIRDDSNNVAYTAIGRIVRQENSLEIINSTDVILYRYGIEFTHPFDFILALSSKNLMVRSCRSLNTKSSLRPEFLA